MAVPFSTLAKDPELYRIVKQRNKVADQAPMLASIMFAMEVGPHTETHMTDTMATDGAHLYWNRTYVLSISDKELRGTLLHEGLHVFLRHHLRRGSIDPVQFNMAADYVINIMVRDGGWDLPKGILYDEKYRGMTVEQIIRAWRNNPEDQPPQPTSPNGEEGEEGKERGGGFPGRPTNFDKPGEIWDATDDDGERLSGDELAEAEEQARRDVIQAEQISKIREAGSGSFNVDQGVYEEARGATLNWREALRDILEKACPQEVTLDTPNRRLLTYGYFPSMNGVAGGDFVIVKDTSGSTYYDREAYAAEIESLRDQIQPDRTIIIYCDDHIQPMANGDKYDVFENHEEIVVRQKDGGGTSFNPPFYLVDQEELTPSVLIYFTDGYGYVNPQVSEMVHYPVIWALSSDGEPSFGGAEFGETLKVEVS